jgi:hypothetical protein
LRVLSGERKAFVSRQLSVGSKNLVKAPPQKRLGEKYMRA